MTAGLLIIAHAPLASALLAVARHAYPERAAKLQALDVPPDATPDEVEAQARALLEAMQWPETLIFTDVFGATPCNVAQRLADGLQVKVVTGVNVPMLWRTLCYAAEPLDMLVGRALAGATQGAMQVTVARPQNQAHFPDPNDQKYAQHQQ
jgi:PTS system ascorbate-specific IIA component